MNMYRRYQDIYDNYAIKYQRYPILCSKDNSPKIERTFPLQIYSLYIYMIQRHKKSRYFRLIAPLTLVYLSSKTHTTKDNIHKIERTLLLQCLEMIKNAIMTLGVLGKIGKIDI